VKVASPGVPDYYQGTELFDFSLVDPDNRRPVDYGVRSTFLDELEKRAPSPAALLANLADGRAKMHIIRQGLALRRTHAAVFHEGEYRALYADGGFEENVIAFSLAAGSRMVVAVAPRLYARKLAVEAVAPVGAFWQDAAVTVMSPEVTFLDVLTGREHRGGRLRLADLLADFPVALLVRK